MWEIFNGKREKWKALEEQAAATAQIVAEKSRECLEGNLKQVVHYGSTAYGQPSKTSDIDVLVVTTKQVEGPHQVAQELVRLSEESGIPQGLLHLVVVTEQEFTAYPPVHPAIFAAFMRGNWLLTQKINLAQRSYID